MKRHIRILISFDTYDQTLRLKKVLIYLQNQRDLSISGTERNGTYNFQKGSAPTTVRYNTHGK